MQPRPIAPTSRLRSLRLCMAGTLARIIPRRWSERRIGILAAYVRFSLGPYSKYELSLCFRACAANLRRAARSRSTSRGIIRASNNRQRSRCGNLRSSTSSSRRSTGVRRGMRCARAPLEERHPDRRRGSTRRVRRARCGIHVAARRAGEARPVCRGKSRSRARCTTATSGANLRRRSPPRAEGERCRYGGGAARGLRHRARARSPPGRARGARRSARRIPSRSHGSPPRRRSGMPVGPTLPRCCGSSCGPAMCRPTSSAPRARRCSVFSARRRYRSSPSCSSRRTTTWSRSRSPRAACRAHCRSCASGSRGRCPTCGARSATSRSR